MLKCSCAILALFSSLGVTLSADWPGLRGSPEHSGFVSADLKRPLRLLWAREFFGERLGTAMEPIIASGRMFVATHSGSLYGLDAGSGEPLWRFQAMGPFLHSPSADAQSVVAASVDGLLYALTPSNGEIRWSAFLDEGGASASPLVVDGKVFLGSRAGAFVCFNSTDGKELWRARLDCPVRQTAAFSDNKVFVTGEDLKVRCFDGRTGNLVWTSEQLSGQTARDYYSIVVAAGARKWVIVRTNPILNMGQRIGRDRTMLARNAGMDDSSWKKTEEWIRSETARGTPELWQKEQAAIISYLETNREARTFFVLDVATGKEEFIAPILWIGGCQGVGAEPAATADGRLLVFYRSAYGSWNHGVAPLVTLGLYDLQKNQVTPLFHQQGRQPAWNCFWGTADESQNFVVCGETALIIHQGTLSGFDLRKNELFPIHGERDTFGGFRSPGWARNEWHGPARAGVAVSEDRLYWQTGSRILCLSPSGQQQKEVKVSASRAADLKPRPSKVIAPKSTSISQRLAQVVEEILSKTWAPLFVDPGLAGRDFSFDKSSDLFEALAWAYPHLSEDQKKRTRDLLAREWTEHPPYSPAGLYSLRDGAPREYFSVPPEFRARLGGDKQPHPFGGVHALWVYANRCGETNRVLAQFPQIKQSFQSFVATGWKLDGNKGDLYANRYISSLLAYAKLAEKAHDSTAAEASKLATSNSEELKRWWKTATGTLTTFNGSAQLDPFINKGDAISFRVAPHRHKLALFRELTPELANLIEAEDVATVLTTFENLYATWYLSGEERQVHFGENFVDPPDLAYGGFEALAFLRKADALTLAARIDLPFCRADLYYAAKLALTLERSAGGAAAPRAPE
jgi:PQQ-like domain